MHYDWIERAVNFLTKMLVYTFCHFFVSGVQIFPPESFLQGLVRVGAQIFQRGCEILKSGLNVSIEVIFLELLKV